MNQIIVVSQRNENNCKPYYILKSFEYDRFLENFLFPSILPQERIFDKLIYTFDWRLRKTESVKTLWYNGFSCNADQFDYWDYY